jgi:glutathione S-transferase
LSAGRRFLIDDRFTAADLTFAALAAPVLLPERYGSPLPPPEAMPDAVSREVWRLRDHPAGIFAARLYREERVANFTGSV